MLFEVVADATHGHRLLNKTSLLTHRPLNNKVRMGSPSIKFVRSLADQASGRSL